MLEILKSKAISFNNQRIDDEFYDRFLDALLKECEDNGMLPPCKELDIASGRILYYYVHDSIEASGILEDIEEINDINMLWEPEDE